MIEARKGSVTLLVESILKRDRAIVAVSIAAATSLAWGYILVGAGMGMPASDMSAVPTALGTMPFMAPATWTLSYAALMLLMWWLMMVGMMLPSATPMILLFAAFARSRQDSRIAAGQVVAFCTAYLLVWALFSVVAVFLQWALDRAGLLSPEMAASSAVVGASLLIAAGVWQCTPAKDLCLRKCRSPVQFLARHWRPGNRGAWRLGLAHGAFCLGCCWVLMLLLFYGGVMNLYWIAGLAVFILLERLAPAGRWMGRLTAALLVIWGVGVILSLT